MQRSNATLFWPALITVTAADQITKMVALAQLSRGPRIAFRAAADPDRWLKWTLVRNPGAAFGLQIVNHTVSRWVFMALTILALGILARLYVNTRQGDWVRTLSLALVCGGAIGNLIDRVAYADGVVDFIDVGVRSARWPTFNLADSAVCVGACLLAWVLWEEEGEAVPIAAPGALSREPGEIS